MSQLAPGFLNFGAIGSQPVPVTISAADSVQITSGVVTLANDVVNPANGQVYGVRNSVRGWFRPTFVNVLDYGADPTGVADSATAISNAIAALPVNGGTVFFAGGTYKIGSTINIGNGSSSAQSTTWGVQLMGDGLPTAPSQFYGVYNISASVILIWAGVSGGHMISVNGPLEGWGVSNMLLNGNSVASQGLGVSSGMFGDCRNLSIIGCTAFGLYSTAVAVSSVGYDSIMNKYSGLYIDVPAVVNATGILLTGGPVTANTCYNLFSSVWISHPGSPATFGLHLGWCDSNNFHLLKILATSSAATDIMFDYTGAGPAVANGFFGFETSGLIVNSGSPGSSPRPNFFYGCMEGNGDTNPVGLVGVVPALPTLVASLSLTGQNASVGTTVVFTPYSNGQFRVSLYLSTIVGAGSASTTTTCNWIDLSGGAQSYTSSGVASGSANHAEHTMMIYANAGTTINFTTTVTGSISTGTYGVWYTVEKLS